jgi:hypothetical protein
VGADSIPQDELENFHDNFEIFAIDNLWDDVWRKPIVEYLRNPTGNVDRKIKYRALSYVIFENDLLLGHVFCICLFKWFKYKIGPTKRLLNICWI